MWALASILLEVLSGFPLWLSLKSRIVTLKNKSIFGSGIFGVAYRDNLKILERQQQLLKGCDIQTAIRKLKKGFDVSKSLEWLNNAYFLDLFEKGWVVLDLLLLDIAFRVVGDTQGVVAILRF